MNIFIDLPFRGKGVIQTEITILLVVGAMKGKKDPPDILSEGYNV